jgi:hypothetical protein
MLDINLLFPSVALGLRVRRERASSRRPMRNRNGGRGGGSTGGAGTCQVGRGVRKPVVGCVSREGACFTRRREDDEKGNGHGLNQDVTERANRSDN